MNTKKISSIAARLTFSDIAIRQTISTSGMKNEMFMLPCLIIQSLRKSILMATMNQGRLERGQFIAALKE